MCGIRQANGSVNMKGKAAVVVESQTIGTLYKPSLPHYHPGDGQGEQRIRHLHRDPQVYCKRSLFECL